VLGIVHCVLIYLGSSHVRTERLVSFKQIVEEDVVVEET
jgi:hypothetical protein